MSKVSFQSGHHKSYLKFFFEKIQKVLTYFDTKEKINFS